MGKGGDLLLEVLIEDGYRPHHLPHLGTDALVHQLLHLSPDLGPVCISVLTKELGAGVGAYLREPR